METTRLTDNELLALFSNGDESAFNAIYDRHVASLLHVAARILENNELAKDVVQEVFVSFYEKGRSKKIDNLHAYLMQSAKYLCFMQLRSGRISEKHLKRMNAVIASNLIDEEIEANELEKILEEEISALPDKCREVFYLSRFEFLPNKTIAEKLRISPKTVEQQITKALKKLRLSLHKVAGVLLFLQF